MIGGVNGWYLQEKNVYICLSVCAHGDSQILQYKIKKTSHFNQISHSKEHTNGYMEQK